jgi:uncharacterized protein (TIGR00725 family)
MRIVIGVMGGGTADERVLDDARRVGRLIAENGWVLLNGGRNAGVMAASARGAAEAGGLVVGVLPDRDWECIAPDVDVPVLTGMGDARNAVNVLSSRVVVALPGGAGTLSEIALALKSGRPVITVGYPLGDEFARYREDGHLIEVASPDEAIAEAQLLLMHDR